MFTMIRRSVAVLFLLTACSMCTSTPHPKPSPLSGSMCVAAQDNLTKLGCESATNFAAGCERAAADGRDWRPDCLAVITACSQVESAYRTPKGQPCR